MIFKLFIEPLSFFNLRPLNCIATFSIVAEMHHADLQKRGHRKLCTLRSCTTWLAAWLSG